MTGSTEVVAAFLQDTVGANDFNGFLILGYVAIWLIGMVYVLSLLVRQRNLRQDIELMEQILQEDEETAVG